MLIIPAIDLKDHQVVRLSQGKMGEAKVYGDDPLEVAQRWVQAGAKRIHLVDLNGAFDGRPVHFDEVNTLVKNFPGVEFEIGGGIRHLQTLDRYFKVGVHYCILGTAAIKDSDFLKEACKAHSHQIILGIDAKQGLVATEGWDEMSGISAIDLALQFKNEKISSLIYTDISKDGMMNGMNFSGIKTMAAGSPFPIIASGGFTSLNDVEELKKIKNVLGVIAGKALYEGLVDLGEAIKLAQ